MEESGYLANILRDRGCPLCGTDRQRVVSPRAGTCGVCHEYLGPEDVLFAAGTRGSHAACSLACLEVLLQEGLADGGTCPLCGSPWPPRPRGEGACGTCASPLRPDAGVAALWRGGRIQRFCGPACVEAYLRRANPFCG